MRALEPAQTGCLRLSGFEIRYEVFGSEAARPVLLLSPWQIVHSRIWKMQVPFLARHFRVITFDLPGNGGAERTLDPAAYHFDRIVDQAAGLLDHLQVATAGVVGLSRSCAFSLLLAARYPERARRLVLIGGALSATGWSLPEDPTFWKRRDGYAGWEKYNAHYWRAHYADWLSFFFSQVFSEPHSTKGIDDACAWGAETTPEILIQTVDRSIYPAQSTPSLLERVHCPVLLIHGEDDRICPIANSQSLAAARPDWEFVTLSGAGHLPNVREPVRVNLLIKDFLDRAA